jgi:hypothetical protein
VLDGGGTKHYDDGPIDTDDDKDVEKEDRERVARLVKWGTEGDGV